MDFLIAGLGLAALAILAGLTLRDRGAFWQRTANPRAADVIADRSARAVGTALLAGGAALIGATAAALVFAPSDTVGAAAVAVVALACIAAAAAWGRVVRNRPVLATSESATVSPARRAAPAMPARQSAAAGRQRGSLSEGRRRTDDRPRDRRAPVERPAPESIPAPASASTSRSPSIAAAPVPAHVPSTEEFDPAMALAHADNHLDLPGHGIAPVRDARPGRVAPPAPLAPFPAERSLERSAAPPSARPEAGSDTDVGIGASTATDSDIDTSIDIDIDDRDLAFAPIPLFRETDPAEDLAHAFVPILDLRGSEPRPLPWETAAADDEFIVDPAVVAERLEDLPPPIPFSRNQPRG